MPAKAKVTKEMIIDAAFEVAREEGQKILTLARFLKSLDVQHSLFYIILRR